MNDESDLDLVQRVRQGDKEAFNLLVQKCTPHLFRMVRWIVGHHEYAEDICQEAWIIALKNLKTLRHDGSVCAWLRTIFRKEALRYLRRASRRDEKNLLEEPTDRRESAPSFNLETEELQRIFQKGIEALPPRSREATVRKLNGQSNADIAQEMQITRASAAQAVSRGLSQLRDWVKEGYSDTLAALLGEDEMGTVVSLPLRFDAETLRFVENRIAALQHVRDAEETQDLEERDDIIWALDTLLTFRAFCGQRLLALLSTLDANTE